MTTTSDCTAVVLSREQWQRVDRDLGKAQHSLILTGARGEAIALSNLRRLVRLAAVAPSDVSAI